MASSKKISLVQFRAEHNLLENAETIVETPVSLTVNGSPWLTFMCTPVLLEEMAIGFLFNEGVIAGIDEVLDVRVCEHEDNIDIWLNRSVERPNSWRRTSGCSGGVTAVDLYSEGLQPISIQSGVVIPEQVNHLVGLLSDIQTLYRKTGGVHTSALSDGESIIFAADDIGRHNTLDKIAGWNLRFQPEINNKVLITTGRISSEMLQKASRIRAEILVSRTSPSSLSIQLADRVGITLIGYARRNSFNVYTHPERIKSDVRYQIATKHGFT